MYCIIIIVIIIILIFSLIFLIYFGFKLINSRVSYSIKDILVNEIIWKIEHIFGYDSYTNIIKNNDLFEEFKYINSKINRFNIRNLFNHLLSKMF